MTGGVPGNVSFTITRHLLQYLSPGLIGFPQALHNRTPAGAPAGAGTGRAPGPAPITAPHEPQNFVPGVMGIPHEGQVCGSAGAGAGGTAGAGTSPTREPQYPQNFSPGFNSWLQAPQRTGEGTRTGSGTTGTAGAGTGAATGAGPASGTPTVCDAPQFRQNFAFSATGFPHSSQNGMTGSRYRDYTRKEKKDYFFLVKTDQIFCATDDGAYFLTRPITASKFSSEQ